MHSVIVRLRCSLLRAHSARRSATLTMLCADALRRSSTRLAGSSLWKLGEGLSEAGALRLPCLQQRTASRCALYLACCRFLRFCFCGAEPDRPLPLAAVLTISFKRLRSIQKPLRSHNFSCICAVQAYECSSPSAAVHLGGSVPRQ